VHVSSQRPTVEQAWLTLEVTGEPPRATVRVAGELDMFTAPRLERKLERLGEYGYRYVDLDIAGLTFVAVAGLTVFVRSDRRFSAVSGRLRLIRPTPMCRRLCAITGLDTTLTIS
jgi:anti-sigma B factor antagonist